MITEIAVTTEIVEMIATETIAIVIRIAVTIVTEMTVAGINLKA